MKTTDKQPITIETTVNASVEKVWSHWTLPDHVTGWCQASVDWYAPYAENDLKVNGKFKTIMAARDGSAGFDFEGVYSQVQLNKLIAYTITDGRKVVVSFSSDGKQTKVVETFETENTNPVEMQREGWQAILENFRKYVEESGRKDTLKFEISINAALEKVYNMMLDKDMYQQWTVVFAPESHFVGSWNKGSKILFLGQGPNGKMGGMVSRIAENIPNQFVSIEHLGIVQDGMEINSGKEVEDWAGLHENYTFKEIKGQTLVSIETEINSEFKELFEDTWPAALKKLREICEKQDEQSFKSTT
jgi:uncharacterized protein YndB with AHSA1/START domain